MIKINFTEEDIQELFDSLGNNRDKQKKVFEWSIDGTQVIITVGNDEE